MEVVAQEQEVPLERDNEITLLHEIDESLRSIRGMMKFFTVVLVIAITLEILRWLM